MLDLDILLKGNIQRIAWTDRYSSFLRLKNENVAEHTCFVTMYAYLIALDMEYQFPGVGVDKLTLFRRAINHDIDEAISGDINRPFKKGYPGLNSMIKEACKILLLPTLGKLSSCPEVMERLIEDMDKGKDKSLEGYILCLADFMSVVSYLISEKRRGSTAIIEDFEKSNKDIESLFLGLSGDMARVLNPYVERLNEIIHRELTEKLTLRTK